MQQINFIDNTAFTAPAWLDRNLYPFKPHFFHTAAGRMHYVDEGQGPPIVFLHGNPGWSFEFRKVISAMATTHRCIAPDLLGFGLSDKPKGWHYLPSEHAEMVAALLDKLNLRQITMVVSDWGGPIGLSYAIRDPNKISRLVMLNTWMWPVKDDPHFRRFSGFMGGPVGRFLIRHFNFFARVILKNAMADASRLSPEVHNQYCAPLATPADRQGCCVFPAQIIAATPWLHELWNSRHLINNLPTAFVWGMKDIAFRQRHLHFWLRHWRADVVLRLDDAGHFPQEERPDAVIKVLRQSSTELKTG